MRRILVRICLTLPLIAGCSTSLDDVPKPKFTADEAIAKTVQEMHKDDFPAKRSKVSGIIHGGGPAPGIRVNGSFESEAANQGDSTYIVTLTEYWSTNDFRTEDKRTADTSRYYWKYLVTPESVKAIGEGGDFPPDHVE